MKVVIDSQNVKSYVADSKVEAKVGNDLANAIRQATMHAKNVVDAASRVGNLAGSLSTIDAQSVNNYAERLTEDLARRDVYMNLMGELGTDRAAVLMLCEDAAECDSFVFVTVAS